MTSGILLLDKPQGLSSNGALQRVRHALGRPKAGHTGSLDPLATGMLPICLGEATKIAGDLLEGRKAYLFTMRLGARTATGDLEGEVVETGPVPVDAPLRLQAAALSLLGASQQIPPMYSALKRDGQPLYKLARQGLEVERAPRAIELSRLELLQTDGADSSWRVLCSKGTYVRVLAEDLARKIGSCAHLIALRREFVEPFEGLPMVTLEQVLAAPGAVALLPADAALPQLPAVTLPAGSLRALFQGRQLQLAQLAPCGRCRLYSPAGLFLGLGEVLPGAVLQPRRLFNDLDPNLLEGA
jgi:tRNA pseudouridine55 synthase